MFYWSILNKSDNELVKQVFNAMRDFPEHNDWLSEVQGVLKKCSISFTEEKIKNMSKIKFKQLVQEKLQLKVTAYLIGLQNKHSTSERLNIKPKIQEFLISEEMSLLEKKFLFKLRSKMLRIKSNFKSIYENDMKC